MEENFFDFAKTKDALGQLAADLAVLESEAQNKAALVEDERKKYRKALSDSDAKTAAMAESVRNTIAKIDAITNYIDGVL